MKKKSIKHLLGKKESDTVREELLARVLNNEAINVKEATDEFWSYKNVLEYIECRSQMQGFITWLKWVIEKKHGRPFRSIDGHGTYKIPSNEEEFEVVTIRHMKKIKSARQSNVLLAKHGSDVLKLTSQGTRKLPFEIVSQHSNPLDENGNGKH